MGQGREVRARSVSTSSAEEAPSQVADLSRGILCKPPEHKYDRSATRYFLSLNIYVISNCECQ